ncbi:hypothetical protein [Rhodanobacter sp. C05]|uniref:hypothetical protein n=1 Tax=Rhodanobacter sp. C05 TaxID=1945855 RepID=UPI0009868363|nr:hypothetical protein [Rhodanobacter sp. C05]OOG38364.1 hypothetical protein B0E51_14405 [Rhodanobacter sp. C05]
MSLAELKTDGWELEDGEARHAEAPTTFEIPPAVERNSLQPGQIVKLMFRIALSDANGEESEHTERMWVIVGGRVGTFYVGTLDNDAGCTNEFKAGLKVVFAPRHVIQIWRES